MHTSDVPGAGTGGGVWVDLEGLVASSGPQDLPAAPLAFERGQVSIILSGKGISLPAMLNSPTCILQRLLRISVSKRAN